MRVFLRPYSEPRLALISSGETLLQDSEPSSDPSRPTRLGTACHQAAARHLGYPAVLQPARLDEQDVPGDPGRYLVNGHLPGIADGPSAHDPRAGGRDPFVTDLEAVRGWALVKRLDEKNPPSSIFKGKSGLCNALSAFAAIGENDQIWRLVLRAGIESARAARTQSWFGKCRREFCPRFCPHPSFFQPASTSY